LAFNSFNASCSSLAISALRFSILLSVIVEVG